MTSTTSNGVFLSNVDDYVSPSQACINPLFSVDPKEPAQHQTTDSRENGKEPSTGISIQPRRRRQRTKLASEENGTAEKKDSTISKAVSSASTSDNNTSAGAVVQASLADCLACSGCVTTTETVLVEEQHSLQVLRARLFVSSLTDQNDKTVAPDESLVVATISPAAWADLQRHLDLPQPAEVTSTDQHSQQCLLQRFTSVLRHYLRIHCVVDGNLPLLWSLQEAADEFCRAYQYVHGDMQTNSTSQHEEWQRKLWPSQAISQNDLKFRSPSTGSLHQVSLSTTKGKSAERLNPTLPLLSGSCPAVVCLVEKTAHAAVPHVSTTASPMSLAGAYLKTGHLGNIFHIAIMPCHDKKLEASRKDFYNASTETGHVDIAITTTEFLTLMQEAMSKTKRDNGMGAPEELSSLKQVRNVILASSPASVFHEWSTESDFTKRLHTTGILLAPREDGLVSVIAGSNGSNVTDTSPFAYSSGGYADFIFRQACQRLFGFQLSQVLWNHASSTYNNNSSTGVSRPQSARVASAAKRRKDFYQVTLYRVTSPSEDGSIPRYSMTPVGNLKNEPVLRFAMAYGMQTLQRVLKPFTDEDSSTAQKLDCHFDYIEAMACPSGCLNGGGQLRLSAKETPTETRVRLSKVTEYVCRPKFQDGISVPLEKKDLHTTYHVVPPMQLSMGAAAGVAVKDIQW